MTEHGRGSAHVVPERAEPMNPLKVDVAARTVEGIVVPYGRVALTRFRRYRFAPGALCCDHAGVHRLLREHSYSLRLGRMVYHENRPDGAFARYLVDRGRRGDEALELAAAGWLWPSVGVDVVESVPDPEHRGVAFRAPRVVAGDDAHGAPRVPVTTTGVCERCLAYPRPLYRWQRAPTHHLLVCWCCWFRYAVRGGV
jgi:hypothetical protein